MNDRLKENFPLDDKENKGQDYGALKSLQATWRISFEHIRAESPSAANLLAVMSFFAPESIPKSLLLPHTELSADQHGHTNRGGDDDSLKGKSEALENDLLTLLKYGVIKVNQTGNEFDMHRFILLSVQEFLLYRRDKVEKI
ncbi:hypothetical protein Ct61P_10457 [Colletotrichum tofieldiae]|nr:hypothetical protein Ct61P_10457 [Colletotrichum tofieldiae]